MTDFNGYALAQDLVSVANAKKNLRTAMVNKGFVMAGVEFADYANLIRGFYIAAPKPEVIPEVTAFYDVYFDEAPLHVLAQKILLKLHNCPTNKELMIKFGDTAPPITSCTTSGSGLSINQNSSGSWSVRANFDTAFGLIEIGLASYPSGSPEAYYDISAHEMYAGGVTTIGINSDDSITTATSSNWKINVQGFNSGDTVHIFYETAPSIYNWGVTNCTIGGVVFECTSTLVNNNKLEWFIDTTSCGIGDVLTLEVSIETLSPMSVSTFRSNAIPKIVLEAYTPVDIHAGDSVTFNLSATSPTNPYRTGQCKPFTLIWPEANGTDVVIALNIVDNSDTYLQLIDGTGTVVESNDDGGGNLNSLLEFNYAAYTAPLTVVATTYGQNNHASMTITVTAPNPVTVPTPEPVPEPTPDALADTSFPPEPPPPEPPLPDFSEYTAPEGQKWGVVWEGAWYLDGRLALTLVDLYAAYEESTTTPQLHNQIVRCESLDTHGIWIFNEDGSRAYQRADSADVTGAFIRRSTNETGSGQDKFYYKRKIVLLPVGSV